MPRKIRSNPEDLGDVGRVPESGMAYGYARCSTSDQPNSIEVQEEAIRAYCARLGLKFGGMFIDRAVSGRIKFAARKAALELCRRLRAGDAVVIYRLDRGFRNASDCLQTLELWRGKGIRLHICNFMGGEMNLATPLGRLMITIMAGFAQWESDLTSERTKDALNAKRQRGEAVGRYAPLGFKFLRRGGKRLLVVDPEERKVMAALVELRKQRYTWDEMTEIVSKEWGLINKYGRPWDRTRIYRATLVEAALRVAEGQPDPLDDGRKDDGR